MLFNGKFIQIREYNKFFRDVTLFLLDNFDIEKHNNSVIILGEYIFKDMQTIRLENPGKKIIIYQLEQLIERSWHNNHGIINNLKKADEVWEYDLQNSHILDSLNIKNTFIPLRYSKSLDLKLNDESKDIDVLFYGFLNHRRLNILEPLQSKNYNGISIVYVYGLYLDKLDEYIKRSKIILNMHAFDNGIQEQVRMLRPICNGKMVISEKSPNNYFGDCIKEFDSIDGLNNLIHYYLDDDKYLEFGSTAYKKFKGVSNET